jgi:glycosyltransferase involved in cell wall biosynthesis
MFVNWPIYRVKKFDHNIRNPDQIISGERYWFSKFWPSEIQVDVVGIRRNFFLHNLEDLSRIYLQHAKAFNRIKDYDLLLTYDTSSAFLFSLLRSKAGVFRLIPHVMIDVGMPRALEDLKNIPSSVLCGTLKQAFNQRSVSRMIFHSQCQSSFYRETLGFPEDMLSYVPFGVETDYFKPESFESEDYIFATGEYRDFNTLLMVYDKWHDRLPELRIRSELPTPKYLPPKVKWLPRTSISTFKAETLKAKLVVVPLHSTLRSVGLMTCLQSMALGKAVIVSKVPPIDGYVEDEKTALYYKPYNLEDLFRKISLLLEDDKLVEDIGKAAREGVVTKFDLENLGKKLWISISKVLESSTNCAQKT